MDDLIDQIEQHLPQRFLRCNGWASLSLTRTDGGFLNVIIVDAKPERTVRISTREAVIPASDPYIIVARRRFNVSELDAALAAMRQRSEP